MSKLHRTLVEQAAAGRTLHGIDIPDLTDRHFWDTIPEGYRTQLIRNGEEALQLPWPALYLSDYMEFSWSGNRSHYEDKYFQRRRMLDDLVLAEAAENKGRFLSRAVDGLWLLLEETSWCLPAHNSYIRDTKQFPVPRDSAPIVDLFAAETAATVGLAEAILRPALAAVSPFLGEYVNTELNRRIFQPYLRYHFWWMGDGRSRMLNWTPWITGNVLLAALTRPEAQETAERFTESMPATGTIPADRLDKEEMARLLAQAAVSLDYFLDEYADDGCCDEGAQYYSHAGLMLYTCLSLLERGLDDPSGIRALEQSALLRNMAAYIVKVHVSGPYYINYADCSPLAGRRTAGEYCWGRDAGIPALMRLAARDFRSASPKERTLPEEISLFQRLRQAAEAGAMLAEVPASVNPSAENPVEETDPAVPDVFYPSTGLLVARDGHLVLACKAGSNGDNHNHNDVGSVIVYRDGQPFLIDVGVETYTAKTFSPERYTIWTMQSQYHNLPTFLLPDGTSVQQAAGADFAASAVSCSLTEDGAAMTMQLEGAYARDLPAGVHYQRKVQFLKETGIEILDQARLPQGVRFVLSLMTYEKPAAAEPAGEGVQQGRIILHIGSLGDLVLDGAADCRVEEIPITDARLAEMWRHSVYRILVTPAADRLRVRITE